MKKAKKYAGSKKLLALGLVIAYVCMATACTNNDKKDNNSDSMAGTTTQDSGSGSAGTNDNNNTNNSNSSNSSDANDTDGSVTGTGGATQGDDDSLLDDAGDVIDNITDDLTGNDETSANGGTVSGGTDTTGSETNNSTPAGNARSNMYGNTTR